MKAAIFSILLFTVVSNQSLADDRFKDVKIDVKQVNDNVYVLYGAGGNIGVLIGEDGMLMIDDQFEPLAPKIEGALLSVTGEKQKIKYVVNTHYHGDHTGSNNYFAKSASILAHENVRKRMSVKGKGAGLPVITYEQGVKLHLNQERIHVKHFPAGHTDGDSVVFFEKANVWHLGDLFFESRFPYIDVKSGGSISGYISNLDMLLTKINDDAKIIPGHGKLTDKNGFTRYIEMIKATKDIVAAEKQSGTTKLQLIESGLGEQWKSWDWVFITEKRWIETLYDNI
jgi:glyoxylase-like metal-dependent hydrolase (beta-lactamase superfamily II)